MTCLAVQRLTKLFGGLTALNGVSFTVEERSITGLIGPNGSGKTVTFDSITGFYRPDSGRVFFRDREITGHPPNEIARHGIARSFQVTGAFPKLTVLQNLVFAAQEKGIVRNVWSSLRRRNALPRDARQRIDHVLSFVGLQKAHDEVVGNLPHGQQKILEFGALMLMNPDPILYLLDEPFAGLTHGEISRYISLMEEMRQRGKTFLVVEHNMRVIMNLCEPIIVLDHGEKIAEGSAAEIQANSRVVEAYLGHGSFARSS